MTRAQGQQRRFRVVPFAFACAAIVAAACADAPTGVGATLDASLSTASLPVTPSSADITGAGDSIIVTIVQPNSCGYQQAAAATRAGSTLDVTLTLSTTGVIPCLPTNGATSYRIAVHPVPGGSYLVHAHFRTATPTDIEDTIVGEGTIVFPLALDRSAGGGHTPMNPSSGVAAYYRAKPSQPTSAS